MYQWSVRIQEARGWACSRHALGSMASRLSHDFMKSMGGGGGINFRQKQTKKLNILIMKGSKKKKDNEERIERKA